MVSYVLVGIDNGLQLFKISRNMTDVMSVKTSKLVNDNFLYIKMLDF